MIIPPLADYGVYDKKKFEQMRANFEEYNKNKKVTWHTGNFDHVLTKFCDDTGYIAIFPKVLQANVTAIFEGKPVGGRGGDSGTGTGAKEKGKGKMVDA